MHGLIWSPGKGTPRTRKSGSATHQRARLAVWRGGSETEVQNTGIAARSGVRVRLGADVDFAVPRPTQASPPSSIQAAQALAKPSLLGRCGCTPHKIHVREEAQNSDS